MDSKIDIPVIGETFRKVIIDIWNGIDGTMFALLGVMIVLVLVEIFLSTLDAYSKSAVKRRARFHAEERKNEQEYERWKRQEQAFQHDPNIKYGYDWRREYSERAARFVRRNRKGGRVYVDHMPNFIDCDGPAYRGNLSYEEKASLYRDGHLSPPVLESKDNMESWGMEFDDREERLNSYSVDESYESKAEDYRHGLKSPPDLPEGVRGNFGKDFDDEDYQYWDHEEMYGKPPVGGVYDDDAFDESERAA